MNPFITDVRKLVPEDLELSITTPHDHENADWNAPVWIVWMHVISHDYPRIDTLCSTEDSCRYHIGAIIESYRSYYESGKLKIYVERIPLNHRFGSSISDELFHQSALSAIT